MKSGVNDWFWMSPPTIIQRLKRNEIALILSEWIILLPEVLYISRGSRSTEGSLKNND